MSAFTQPPQHPSLRNPPHRAFPRQDHSALDLLSRVALEQYHITPPLQSSRTFSRTFNDKIPPSSRNDAQPPLRSHSHVPCPRFDGSRQVCSADFSPVSSDDGSSSRTHRQPSQLPHRLNKIMRVSKEQSIAKTRTQPSRFCHICSRTSKKVGLVACGNFANGACRKVVCQKCFNDHDWDWKHTLDMGSKWICTHCRQVCPERAQCAIYKRTNERRREQQQRQRVVIRTDASGTIRGGHGRFINKPHD